MRLEVRVAHEAVHLGLLGEVHDIELAARDRLDVGQRGPDEVGHTRGLRSLDGGLALRNLVDAGARPEVGHDERPVGTLEGGTQGLGFGQVGRDDLVCLQRGRLVGGSGDDPDAELALCLQSTDDAAPLLSGGSENDDGLLGIGHGLSSTGVLDLCS